MSKSLNRVKTALQTAGLDVDILDMPGGTRTAQDAATAAGCAVDQIAKSIIFATQGTGDHASGEPVLFITAGAQRVDDTKASALVGQNLGKADAGLIRAHTGFAIGGVSPIGHVSPIRAWFDPHLLQFDIVYAAAGTPRHIFAITPQDLLRLSAATMAEFTA
jgi:prolyl-tRNA editing enzyme YbaK/EbsC (Cys-tRNA(Pro) deacylase)